MANYDKAMELIFKTIDLQAEHDLDLKEFEDVKLLTLLNKHLLRAIRSHKDGNADGVCVGLAFIAGACLEGLARQPNNVDLAMHSFR